MSHSYKLNTVNGGLVIQGDYHSHNEVHHHQQQHSRLQQGEDINVIATWLSTLNFATTLQTHCNKRTPETGSWLLEHEVFCKWIAHDADDERVMWCKGDPGVGKTVLW